MPYIRPNYDEIAKRINTDLVSFPEPLRVAFGKAHARATHGIHGHLDYLYLQTSPLTCDEERLAEWAQLYGVTRLAPTRAYGGIVGGGNNGARLLAEVLLRGDNGEDYRVLAAVDVASGALTAQVMAVNAGAIGNLPNGAKLTIIDPQAGINANFVVGVDGLGGGADQETVEAWRARVVDEWTQITTNGARGGKPADYAYWAKSAHASVIGAYVTPHGMGTGSVVVRPVVTGDNPIPSAQVLQAVRDYLADIAPAPTSSFVYVIAPTIKLVPLTLDLGATVDTPANRTAMTAAATTTINALTATPQATLKLDALRGALDDITTDFTLLLPVTNVSAGAGEVLRLGVITWI